jgi:plastocyanin
MKKNLFYPIVFLLIVFAISLVSCGKSSGYGSMSTTPPPAAANTVNIVNMSFSPSGLTVSVGTTVTWTNSDAMDHTVTSDNGLFDSGDISDHKTYSRMFSTAGTFPYHCTIHPGMTGTITVK